MKKRFLSLLLAGTMLFSTLTLGGCGTGGDSSENSSFKWWIYATDGGGTYYEKYEDNPAVQWLNQQYWDVDNHTIGNSENGVGFQLTFQAPVTGSEQENFNNMIATGEYPELIDLLAAGSKESLIEDGILMDITEYVEKYMPDYVALLDAHPDWKSQVTYTDEEGNTQYYYIASINDGPTDSWDCFEYRRDWVVQYAEPTEYVWDWDSDYVKTNGHPAVTPLEEAVESGNLEGWKKNEVTAFESSDGNDPGNTYTDNVIFPSGTSDPLTVSDWEWMLEAFEKAIADRGWTDDSNAYPTSVSYTGYYTLGDLTSSFGGATGSYYVTRDGEVIFSGITDNFKTYLECMHTWYEEGWLDKNFASRATDMFYNINETGCTSGKVGLWLGTVGTLGTVIRSSCADSGDQQTAYVKGCSLPLNDKYGTDEQKFTAPDALYQMAAGYDNAVGITEKALEKDEDALAALFTYFNWCFTREGALYSSFGLNQEQYESVTLENDLYAEYGFENGMYHIEDRDGVETIVSHLDQDSGLNINAFKPCRLTGHYNMTGHGDVDYQVDNGYDKVIQDAIDAYGKYVNTGSIFPYMGKMNDEESDTYNKIDTAVKDYSYAAIPDMIKNGLDDWDAYVEKINTFDVETACDIYQKYVDEANGSKGE